jgi:N-acyl homoserine lactone hydrolase
MTVTVRAFTCGWIQSPLTFFLGGHDKTVIRAPVPAYLIEHPKGLALFDTGLGARFQRDIEERLGPEQTGFEFDEHSDIAARMRAVGIDPASVAWIINSHFHADHCGGNASIPNATVIVQSRELAKARAEEGSQLYKAEDFAVGHPIKAIEGELDLFGDGTVRIVPTPGHTPGHQSAIVRLASGDVLLAADCCYLQRSLERLQVSPSDDDPATALKTLQRLAALRQRGTRIFFGHDPEFWKTVPVGIAIG